MFDALLTDREVDALLADEALARAMVEVEAALARVQGRLDVIDREAAARIDAALAVFDPDLDGIEKGVLRSAMPVPALVGQLRSHLGGELGSLVHWGATSQDIVDTALILRLRTVLDLLAERLVDTLLAMIELSERHTDTVMLARTRFQQALPTTFGLKVSGWLLPLVRHLQRLEELRPRLLAVQFGGAAGTLAPLGGRGAEVMDALADELGLASPQMPWHSQRDGLVELAGWLALVSGSLGKIGADILLMALNEVGELREAEGGGSSTLPQKSNPIRAEALVTLARRNAGELASMAGAMVHVHERDGTAWQLEWLALPSMLSATAAALDHARTLARSLVVDPERMGANIEASHGLVLAEAASFALGGHMPRGEAQALVGAACRDALAEGRHLVAVLRERTDAPVSWDELANPGQHLGAARTFQARALAAARAALAGRVGAGGG